MLMKEGLLNELVSRGKTDLESMFQPYFVFIIQAG